MSVTSIAKHRWKILSKALCRYPNNKHKINESPTSSLHDECLASVRRFTRFNLFDRNALIDSEPNWFSYSTKINGQEHSLIIHEIQQKFTPEDLIGFNNTGNICVWPSEETLAYYVLSNISLFRHQRILELGGGMSCLAGLFAAKYGEIDFIHLTDGNEVSVENVKKILKRNSCNLLTKQKCSILKWETVNETDENDQYDCILSADCLFFDSSRSFFVNSLWQYLKLNGFALIMAPARGDTLNKFILNAQQIGFECKLKKCYNGFVWQKHLNFLQTDSYEEDIHYPLLIEIRKKLLPNQ